MTVWPSSSTMSKPWRRTSSSKDSRVRKSLCNSTARHPTRRSHARSAVKIVPSDPSISILTRSTCSEPVMLMSVDMLRPGIKPGCGASVMNLGSIRNDAAYGTLCEGSSKKQS
jgi:hypothetical protein